MVSRRRTVALVAVLVAALVAVVLGRKVWQDLHRTALSEALDRVPAATQRLAFTDWESVRRALDVPEQTRPTDANIERLAARAYDADLSAASSIDESTAALQEHFGFSAATVLWEAFSQSDEGAVMVVRMPDDFDMGQVEDHLADLGFTEPSRSTGVWQGGADLVAAIDPTITPELQYVAVLADQHLVVTSDEEDYAKQAAEVAQGDRDSLADVGATRELVDTLDEPAAALVWPGDFACDDLAMSQADEDSQDRADVLVDEAGGVSPMTGLVMALQPDRDLVVAALFEDSGQAKANLGPRAELAVGEAPGRGGSFSDDLRLVTSRTDGSVVLLELRPKAESGFVLSALYDGPVLFATC